MVRNWDCCILIFYTFTVFNSQYPEKKKRNGGSEIHLKFQNHVPYTTYKGITSISCIKNVKNNIIEGNMNTYREHVIAACICMELLTLYLYSKQ